VPGDSTEFLADTLSEVGADSTHTQRFLSEVEEQRVRMAADARRAMELIDAEEPLGADLRAAGSRALWRLDPREGPYPEALPILITHLERGGYPDLTTNRIGRALGVRAAVVYWDRLKAIWLNPRNPAEEEAAALALSGCAGAAQLEDLIDFVNMSERGSSRIYFLRPMRRIGRKRVQDLLEQLGTDPVLGSEATRILKGRSPND